MTENRKITSFSFLVAIINQAIAGQSGLSPVSSRDDFIDFEFTPADFLAHINSSTFGLHLLDENEPITGIPYQNSSSNPTDLTPEQLLSNDPILSELIASNAVDSDGEFQITVEEYARGKRGAIQLAKIMKCATGCDPLSYKGYGCYCGFLGDGTPADGIDKCCKMHDWCYTTSTCMGLQWHLPYFVPFKWKCNGGAPYCIPGKGRDNGRDSCSHQLCECDRQFAMCLKSFPCPRHPKKCRKVPQRLVQNMVMDVGSLHGATYSHSPNHGHRLSHGPPGHHHGHHQVHGPPPPHSHYPPPQSRKPKFLESIGKFFG